MASLSPEKQEGLTMGDDMTCLTCRGSGEYRSGLHPLPCPSCDGSGKQVLIVAQQDHHIRLTANEHARLIQEFIPTECVFGPGWCALLWRKGEQTPLAVQRLAQMRGVGTQGRDGDGI
jgi:hypothetical protein